MASSKASNAGSSYKEQREQKVLDVMFLCDEWKSSKGGLSTFNREFAINLAQATTGSMTIHCYVSNSDDRDREDAKQHGVNLITARSVPGSTDRLEGLKFSPPELPNPHLVIGHGRKLGCPAYSLLQNTKCKWIQFVHVYCEDLGKYKGSATAAEDTIEENEKKHKMEIELCEAADAVVAVGSRLQRKYSRRLLNVEVKIITPGIFGRFSNESKLAVDRSVVKNFNVSLFGRAAFEDLSLKGYDVVANAIGSLGENYELTFVGSSPGEQRKVEQWFLDNTCINRNQLTIRRYCSEQEELKMMFYQSDLVALPSRTEGFGLVALEAISAGVPVLVSSESGIAEALQKVDGGNTVIVGSGENEDKWARRIREMYGESAEEREAKAVKLRENYRKVYSWKAECERFKGLIENVMETANGGEMNINVDVDDLKPEEQNMQTGMLATESVRCQEVQQPRASATSAASGSVSYSQKEDLNALEKKIFLSIVQNYLQTTPPQSPEEHSRFMEYTQKMRLIITGVAVGSLVITVKCESLKILEELWTDYSSGHLGEVVQKCFVTEKILKELNLAELRLKTTMDIEEYNACKMFFEKDALRDALSSEFHTTSSTSESPQKKEQWEKSEQKTKIMETVKLEGASSSEFHYTSSTSESPQKQEELKKWKQKTKIVETEKLKGTLPITVIPTTGRGIELIGRAQGRKGMLPLLGSSTSDPEEELEELRMKLQIMKDASSSEFHSISSTSESPQNQKELKKLKQKTKIVETEKPKGTSTLTVIPTTGRGKELIEKGQGRKGSSPPPPLSTTDFEEKLAKVCEEIKMLRMEGTLPPPELLNLEKELKQLTELFTQKKEDDQEGGELFLSAPVTFIAVVAIDFGTTFSGFAFAFNNRQGEKSIHMNKEWGTDQGYSTMKTPTCLLLNPDKSFNSFGYEAQDRYADLEEEEARQFFYFDSFKMILHNNENLNRNTTLEAGNGRQMKALDVFKYSIQYLYTRALEVIKERTGDENFGKSDVQWVLTVPAIWKPEAKQFMREAAYQAGLACPSNPEQILIALEPEAASFYCREQKMRDFIAESENNDASVTDTIAGTETQYVVVDIGGGTLDVTVHELVGNGGIRELYKATGGTFGGQNVNRQFRILLEMIFSKSFIDNYARRNPVDWLCLMNDFEVKKRGKRICEGGTTRIRLPVSFINKFPSHKGWDINTAIQQHYSLDEIKVVRNEYLCLEPKVMRQLFNPVLDDIISHLSNLFAQPELSEVKFAFLVGGFGDSAVLQERINRHFGQTYRILVPQYASLAVVQGAVMFGQKPDTFESRIMATTYGIRVHKLFLDGLHPESKKEIIAGIPRCKDVFFKFVRANEVVRVGEKRRFTGFAPLTGEQKQMIIDFYQSERSDVEFVTDPEVQKAPGQGLVLETPEAWKTKDIEINLLFGGTEIKVTAVNLTSNRQSTVYLDFLASS